jgi:GDP-mannose 6-dehydrogenase
MEGLAERCLGRGLEVLIWDDQVHMSSIQGANRAFIEDRIPHLSALLVPSAQDVVAHADVVVRSTTKTEAVHAVTDAGDTIDRIVDLARIDHDAITAHEGYSGVAW